MHDKGSIPPGGGGSLINKKRWDLVNLEKQKMPSAPHPVGQGKCQMTARSPLLRPPSPGQPPAHSGLLEMCVG